MNDDVRVLALDVTDILLTPRGQKVINALLSSKGKLYCTARGRTAIQIAPETFDRIKGQLKVQLGEGYDGTKAVTLAAEIVRAAPLLQPDAAA